MTGIILRSIIGNSLGILTCLWHYFRKENTLAGKLAAKLQSGGVEKGDAIAVVLPHSIDFIASMLAGMKLGAAVAPLNGSYPPDRLAYIFHDCQAKAVITPDYVKDVDDYSPVEQGAPISPDDEALLVYTSGSTGNPKGVLIDYRAIFDSMDRTVKFTELTRQDVIGLGASFFFIAGSINLFVGLGFNLDKAYDNTPVGTPLGDIKAYLLDEDGNEAQEGELCLTGHFAKCYINRPEESEKTFVPNPFRKKDGHPMMLRIGDLARALPDGNRKQNRIRRRQQYSPVSLPTRILQMELCL